VSGSGRLLASLLVVVLTLVLAGCGASGSSNGPTSSTDPGSPDPSASPAPSLDVEDIAVCRATLRMEDGLARVQAVKLRQGARNRLDQAMQSVLTGQDALLQHAQYDMRTRLRTLGLAVTNMTLAVEDFQTTDHIDVASANVRRASAQLHRAIDSFQRWLGCDSIVLPSEPPGSSPSAEPSLPPYLDESPAPSVEG
jgi:hypothetical protein